MYKSKKTSFNGIWKWVSLNRYDLIKGKPITKEESNLKKLMKRFLIENKLPMVRQTNKNHNNVIVQQNFKKFKQWVLKQ